MRIMGQMSKRTMDKMQVRTVVMTKEFTVFLVIMTHENKINFDMAAYLQMYSCMDSCIK
jgi:hypothetical protein